MKLNDFNRKNVNNFTNLYGTENSKRLIQRNIVRDDNLTDIRNVNLSIAIK